MSNESSLQFQDLELHPAVLRALDDVGYESPSPIQARTIPLLLSGSDVVGQAQTGTGKTAAFALPILTRINIRESNTQVLVLAPTRELAIQVAEAFQKYAAHLKGFHVLPVYGGQDYRGQIRALKRGAHVVVGTPGRVMDHMRRGTLKLDNLTSLVLDEADEMLKMGFIDDVEWILQQSPSQRQIALFSATMPQQIRKIANEHLNDPVEVTIQVKTTTAESIRQRFWPVRGVHKLDALTRILEAEPFDAMIVFVRTKSATEELAGKLQARGFSTAALNGDIPQKMRERTIDQLKNGQIDILVATDVAARGLDVERISHVVNYDIPYDTEAYVHRIGRTGRAGREGDAILFVAPRERRMLGAIEKATGKKIDQMALPTTDLINNRRIERFREQISELIENEDLTTFTELVENYIADHDVNAIQTAAALARMAQGDAPFLLQNKPEPQFSEDWDKGKSRRDRDGERHDRKGRKDRKKISDIEEGMERFRLEVGHRHQVKPGNIVGAIANEAGIESKYIGRIHIFEDFSLIDLPEGMPREILKHLKGVWVSGQQLRISRDRKGSGRKNKHDRKSSDHDNSDKRSGKTEHKHSKKNKHDRKPSEGESLSRIPPKKRN